jgi:hypothetical protein
VTVPFFLRDMCTGFDVPRIGSWSGMCEHGGGSPRSVTGNLLRHLRFTARNVRKTIFWDSFFVDYLKTFSLASILDVRPCSLVGSYHITRVYSQRNIILRNFLINLLLIKIP